MSTVLQAVRGMNDVLPADMALWRSFGAIVETSLERWGYRAIRMPLVENTALFRRAIGEATDIVEKEMYTFVDELNGEQLTLRPEATAQVRIKLNRSDRATGGLSDDGRDARAEEFDRSHDLRVSQETIVDEDGQTR